MPIDALPSVSGTPRELVLLKGFIHEVLCQSRTSGSVLQTALCYIEAVRAKLPGLLEWEAKGEGVQGGPQMESKSRIVLGEDDSKLIKQHNILLNISSIIDIKNSVPMTMCRDFCLDCKAAPSSFITGAPTPFSIATIAPQAFGKVCKTPSALLAPLPLLPSPLLCPCRTFLASLILALKFTQDQCYSVCTWTKLFGLPAREIGWCKRVLGNALEWCLWVGKMVHTTTAVLTHSSMSNNRVVTCSRSECNRSEGDITVGAMVLTASVWRCPQILMPVTAPC